MLASDTLRGFFLDQLNKGLQIVDTILKTTSPADLTAYRDGGSGWTALETLCHLRDFEAVFYERACMTVDQDTPELPVPNPDTMAQEGRYHEQDAAAVYQAWVEQRKEFIRYLQNVDAAAWQREAKHPKRGMMSLQDQLTLTAWHDVNHIEQMTRILAERK